MWGVFQIKQAYLMDGGIYIKNADHETHLNLTGHQVSCRAADHPGHCLTNIYYDFTQKSFSV